MKDRKRSSSLLHSIIPHFSALDRGKNAVENVGFAFFARIFKAIKNCYVLRSNFKKKCLHYDKPRRVVLTKDVTIQLVMAGSLKIRTKKISVFQIKVRAM